MTQPHAAARAVMVAWPRLTDAERCAILDLLRSALERIDAEGGDA